MTSYRKWEERAQLKSFLFLSPSKVVGEEDVGEEVERFLEGPKFLL